MDTVRALAEAGAPEGTMVQAGIQTAGRGRMGNTWTSPPGNLYLTTLLRPQAPLRAVAQLSFVAALALADAIDGCGAAHLTLKWPNDVLVGGRKIAGILLEVQGGRGELPPDFLLIGTGVNIDVAPPEGAQVNDGNTMRRDAAFVRDSYFERLSHWYAAWQEQGFAPVRAAWMARAHGLGGPITARLGEGSVQGVFDGIDGQGGLILRRGDGVAQIVSGGAVHFGNA
ncbi:MAG: biotin--[acetyl-CoA-carboxylase] ligase [Rhodospirillales bacterium]|nr:biotin--[acetyl-CoA-carboxylase] ligase [Alphaproteobacteria bacterium]MCB9987354.1 biotin--[acetyl-CoA-carboxylase] ligase [Rhodospirillales bacterium]USO07797.1 MAG: biotin--[acetyl-CoA-carboxylase] ligase [Rhodospirillales bacterium]